MTAEELSDALNEITQATDATIKEELMQALVQRLTEYPAQ